jgi:endonuclease IV/intein/homing endonuclease
MKVGVHVSIRDSIDQAVDRAKEEGCDTFQVFTRNPRGWKFSDLDPEEVTTYKEKLAESGLGPVVDHMPYLPNLSCPEDELYEKSTATLLAEVDRCGTLGIQYLVCHLGSHLGMGRDVGLQRLTDALNLAVKRVKKDPWILLENMAGQKNSMGSNFHDIQEVIDGVKNKEKLGVCLDTCLPPGSLVFSNEVPTPIEEVKPLDTVLNSDGQPDRVVTVLERQYSGNLVSIKPEGLPWIRMTSEHPVLCLRPKGWRHLDSNPWRVRLVSQPKWVYAQEVKPGYFVVMPKLASCDTTHVDFRRYIGAATRRFRFPPVLPLTNALAELLGLYLAEGFTLMGHNDRGEIGKVYFAFGHHETTFIHRVESLVEELFSLKTWLDDSGTATKVCVGSNILTRFFRDVFGTKATTKKIPSLILRAPPDRIKAFLHGYLLGDGCKDQRGIRYVTGSRTIAYQLMHLLAKIDIRGTISKHNPTQGLIGKRILRSLGWYTVHVGSHEARKLGFDYEFPRAPPRRIIRDTRHFYVPVREIRVESYHGKVRNLTTENGTFTAPFVVTHNCHAYAAGMDLHTEKGVALTLDSFDKEIGFDRLKVVHLNDSEGGQGSGLDRHEHIGMGYIGAKGFKTLLHHDHIRDLPWILETPEDERRDDKGNLAMVRKLAK